MMSRHFFTCLTSITFLASSAVHASTLDSAKILEKICVNDAKREASFRSAHPSLDRLYQDVCNRGALIPGINLHRESHQALQKSPSAVKVAANAEAIPLKSAPDSLASKLQKFFKAPKGEKKVDESSSEESVASEPLEVSEKNSIPEAIRGKVKSLAEDQKPLFYGAYKAGFAHIIDIQSDVVLLRIRSTADAELTHFDLLGSFSQPRRMDGELKYLSFISEIEYQCGKNLQRTMVQEYKSGVFGSGKTIKTYRLKNQDKPFRKLSNKQLIAFIEKVACEQ